MTATDTAMMVFKSVKSAIRHLTHRRFKSAEDYFRKRTRFREINEFFMYQINSTDSEFYTLPFVANQFRAAKEKASWPDREDLSYEYPDDKPAKQGSGTRRSEALGRFAITHDLVKDRVDADAVILDVCRNSGSSSISSTTSAPLTCTAYEPRARTRTAAP